MTTGERAIDASIHQPQASSKTAENEVVDICRALIQIDTQNFGDDSGPGERRAAEYVMELLSEVGIDAQLIESSPRRANVIARIPGRDPNRPALVLHGHLDVVPAIASEWTMPPLGAEIKDGMIWGRGAVDMKDMNAMMLAVIRELARSKTQPPRDVILAFFADEETGGGKGAQYIVERHRGLFDNASEAISEVGGFSVEVAGQRVYLLQTAEKSLAWLNLVAHRAAGHGSQDATENAIVDLAEAIARIGSHRWPRQLTPTVRRLFTGVAELVGKRFDEDDPNSIDELLAALGPARRFVGASVRTTTNPTRLNAGYKDNVIPQSACGTLDARFLPGTHESDMRTLKELAGPYVDIDVIHQDQAVEAPWDSPLVTKMVQAIESHDPQATVLPYMLSAGTDNKSLAKLGISGYGFAPLQLPRELDFTALFHGVDERVPIASLQFGVSVLRDLLLDC